MECPECGGTGNLPNRDDECWRCEGTGEVDPELEAYERDVDRGIQEHRERHLDW